MHQFLYNEALKNVIKSLGEILQTISTAHATSAEHSTLLKEEIRFVKHDLPSVGHHFPMLAFPKQCHSFDL